MNAKNAIGFGFPGGRASEASFGGPDMVIALFCIGWFLFGAGLGPMFGMPEATWLPSHVAGPIGAVILFGLYIRHALRGGKLHPF